MTQDIFAAIAKAKGRAAATPTGALYLPFSDAAQKEQLERQKEEQARRDAEIWAHAQTGEVMPDGTVYLGTFWPSQFLPAYDVYAAPEDLPGAHTYRDTNAQLSALKGWHGHDGAAYNTDDDLFDALNQGRYHGEWIVPPVTLLDNPLGDITGEASQTLFRARDTGAFRNSFKTASAAPADKDRSEYYWSSTVGKDRNWVRMVDCISDPAIPRLIMAADENDLLCSCRPVRLEPVP